MVDFARADRMDPAADIRCEVEFNLHPVLDVIASHLHDRPIYHDELYIKVYGKTLDGHNSKNQIDHRKATEADKKKYPVEYEKFMAEGSDLQDGTPIGILVRSPVKLQELADKGIRTIEKFLESDYDDSKLRKMCKAFVAAMAADDTVVQIKRRRGRPKKVKNGDT